MRTLKCTCIAIVMMLTAACHSTPLRIQTPPMGPNEKVVGYTEGSSTGIMLF